MPDIKLLSFKQTYCKLRSKRQTLVKCHYNFHRSISFQYIFFQQPKHLEKLGAYVKNCVESTIMLRVWWNNIYSQYVNSKTCINNQTLFVKLDSENMSLFLPPRCFSTISFSVAKLLLDL